ncbi:hypothetical protein HYS91_01240 [Candidatus Daviesbacteria bacterium]|nr:hypothetical protein [Candidatus Daviesbacteria bacterium]
MAKYDSQIADLPSKVQTAGNILISLPVNITIDHLAAGLALYLSLQSKGYQNVSIATEGQILVSHSNLFGIGEVKKELPSSGGNLILTLEGVVASDGTVPALEKLDWYPQGQDLNLVFHILPGQKFEPRNITPKYQSSGFNLIFTVGTTNLNELGGTYLNNTNSFQGVPLVNIDNQANNSMFGTYNIVDANASSLSEMVANLMPSLGLTLDVDSGTNISIGIYSATNNLTSRVSADTFLSLANAMQAGAKNPLTQAQPSAAPQPIQQPTPQTQQPGFDLRGFTGQIPSQQQVQTDNFTVPPVINSQPEQTQAQSAPTEEVPSGEYATSSSGEGEASPAPDWLTPKVYKGTSLG